MKSSAYSVGISDLIANQETNDSIIQAILRKKADVKNLIHQIQIGIFENNTGKTNQEEFETRVNAILNKAQEEAGKIGRNSLSKNNRFVTMVKAGSKGNNINIAQMISCLGIKVCIFEADIWSSRIRRCSCLLRSARRIPELA